MSDPLQRLGITFEDIRRLLGLLTADPNMDEADVEALFDDSVQNPEAYFGVLIPDDPMEEGE